METYCRRVSTIAGELRNAAGSAGLPAVPAAGWSSGTQAAKLPKAERARWVLQGLGGASDDTPAKPTEPERATDSKEARRRERGSVRRSTRTRRADEPGTLTAATKPRRAADVALGEARGDGARRGDGEKERGKTACLWKNTLVFFLQHVSVVLI